MKQISRKNEDILRDVDRYIEDLQTAISREVKDEVDQFTNDVVKIS